MDPLEPFGTEWDRDIRELRVRLAAAGFFLIPVLLVGVVGYRLQVLGTGWVDSLYMTVITLTTVGFTEVADLTGHTSGRLFTVLLIFLGMGGPLLRLDGHGLRPQGSARPRLPEASHGTTRVEPVGPPHRLRLRGNGDLHLVGAECRASPSRDHLRRSGRGEEPPEGAGRPSHDRG